MQLGKNKRKKYTSKIATKTDERDLAAIKKIEGGRGDFSWLILMNK